MSGSEIVYVFVLPREIPCGGTFDLSIHSTIEMPQWSLALIRTNPFRTAQLGGGVMRTSQPIQIR